MKIKNGRNYRPKSCNMKNIAINKNINRFIPISCGRVFSSKINSNNFENKNKKKYKPKTPYTEMFNNQLKKFDMYKEMWDKSLSNEDNLGIENTIQINPENFPSNLVKERFKANATSTRKNSALIYNDLSYKSKRVMRNMKTNNKNNIWNIRNSSNIITTNINNKIGTNTFWEIYRDKDNFVNFSNYNSTFHSNTKNNLNTDYSQNQNYLDSNTTNNNLSNNTEYFNYGVPRNRSKKKEIVVINENKKSLDTAEDKNNFEKMVKENDNSILNLRTNYLIKFAKLIGIVKKFLNTMDFFRIEKRDIFTLYMKNLTNAFDNCNDFFINQIKEGDTLNLDRWTKMLMEYYNLSFHVIKLQSYAFTEMHFLKNENIVLKQKLHGTENELNIRKKDINDINKYIIQYDLTNKVKYKKKKEMTINEIKQKYNSKESAYITTIYQLEQEIKKLTEVLNQNKFDINNFNEVNEKLKKLKEEFEENRNIFDKQSSEKNLMIKVLAQTNSDLNEKINELENEIQKNKEKEEEINRKFIDNDAKLKALNEVIKQKNTLIEQLKDENKILLEKNNKESAKLLPVEATLLSPQGNLRKKYKKEIDNEKET